jgi:rRNA-processing protein FCF1
MKYLVLDSNILLHYKCFEDIPWQEELGCGEVTIVLTAMVLEEIDKKKDQEKGKIQKRAKAVSSRICEILIDGKTSKYPVVFLESAFATEDERRQYHLDSNDNQILFDVMRSEMNLEDFVVVSSDNPMLIRAKQRGLKILKLDDKYRLKDELSKEEKEAQAAITELARLKSRLPEPKLIFEDGGNHIQIKRVTTYDFEEEVKVRMNELRCRWPEKTIEDEQEIIMGHVFYRVSQEQILKYNISRNKFIEQSEKKVRLEVERDDLDRRMKKITISVYNSGNASTGKMNIFVDIPEGIKLYEENSKKKIEYDEPSTPNYSGITPIPQFNSMYGYYKPSIKMWDSDDYIKKRQLKETSEPLTHTLLREVFSFYVDSATCPNFGLKWYIADAALVDPILGELNVSFVEE